jgi:hypothetical protein
LSTPRPQETLLLPLPQGHSPLLSPRTAQASQSQTWGRRGSHGRKRALHGRERRQSEFGVLGFYRTPGIFTPGRSVSHSPAHTGSAVKGGHTVAGQVSKAKYLLISSRARGTDFPSVPEVTLGPSVQEGGSRSQLSQNHLCSLIGYFFKL